MAESAAAATPGIGAETAYKSVIGAHFNECSEGIKTFIKENAICREQIISISAHEEGVNDGKDDPDVELVLYYSTKAVVNGQPLDGLQHSVIKDTKLWPDLEEALKSGAAHKDYVAIT